MKSIYNPTYIRLITALRRRRTELGLSQTEVAKRLGISRMYIVRLEKRDRRLDVLEARELLEVYKMKLQDLDTLLGAEKRHP